MMENSKDFKYFCPIRVYKGKLGFPHYINFHILLIIQYLNQKFLKKQTTSSQDNYNTCKALN